MLKYLSTTFTFGKQTKDNFINRKFQCRPTYSFIHSFFVPDFPLGRIGVAAALGGPEIPHDHSNLRWFCWLHAKTRPSKVGDIVTPPGPWTTSGPLSRGCGLYPEGLISPFFPGTFWTHGRTNIAGISQFGEMASHPGLYGFQTCAFCHEVSHRRLLSSIPFLPFVLFTVVFRSSPHIHDHR